MDKKIELAIEGKTSIGHLKGKGLMPGWIEINQKESFNEPSIILGHEYLGFGKIEKAILFESGLGMERSLRCKQHILIDGNFIWIQKNFLEKLDKNAQVYLHLIPTSKGSNPVGLVYA